MVSLKPFLYVCCCYLILVLHSALAEPLTGTKTETIRVAVASNFKPVVTQLISQFEQQNPVSKIQLSSASSGVLYAQILRGAPFDLFLSADELRPALLEEKGMILANSRTTYAFGTLVLWASDKTVQSKNDLQYYAGKIAIANPELAPFGRASHEALTALKLLPAKQNNVVMANNVLQVAHMLHSGAVDLGLVSASQVKNVPEHQLWYVPEDLFSPIVQQIVILEQTKNGDRRRQGVNSFYRYILSSEGQEIIANNGYGVIINAMRSNEHAYD